MNTWIKNNWPRVLALNVAASLLFWAIGCQPTVPSLTRPEVQLTRGALQVEMEALIQTYELRNAELAQQERLRKLIAENALLIASTGTYNPVGILTGIAALYGIGSAATDTKKAIVTKIAKSKLNHF